MSDQLMVKIPDMTVDEAEQSVYNLEECIEAIDRSMKVADTPELIAQCAFVKDSIEKAAAKLRTGLILAGITIELRPRQELL